jgi:anti-sigma-K factor RskA
MTRDDDLDRLAAEHVLGLLDGEECARADRLIATDAAFVQAVTRCPCPGVTMKEVDRAGSIERVHRSR